MADSKLRYCRLCNGPCDDCEICLRNSDRFNPSTDMIKTALEKKGAFTSSEFRTISSNPPEITVSEDVNGTKVDVRLTSMRFIAEYRDPQSPERKKLEKAAREEIFRSFSLPRDRVRDGDIEVDIREGSVEILVVLNASIIAIAAITIAGLCYADDKQKEASKQNDLPKTGMATNDLRYIPYSVPAVPTGGFYVAPSNTAHDIKTVGSGATGAVLGATAGVAAGPVGMAVGGAIGFIAGTVFGDTFFK